MPSSALAARPISGDAESIRLPNWLLGTPRVLMTQMVSVSPVRITSAAVSKKLCQSSSVPMCCAALGLLRIVEVESGKAFHVGTRITSLEILSAM